MLDISPWVNEFRQKRFINIKKAKKYEKIIEEPIKTGRHLANSELTLNVENSVTGDEY
jgi:hypothetical protein